MEVVQKLLESGIPSENILVLAPRGAPVTGIKENLKKLFPQGYSELWLETGAGFCRNLLRRFPLGLTRGLDTVRGWQQYVLFDEATRGVELLSVFKRVREKRSFILRAMAISNMLEANDINSHDFNAWAEETGNVKFIDLAGMYSRNKDFCAKTGIYTTAGLAQLVVERLVVSPQLARAMGSRINNIILNPTFLYRLVP